MPGTLKLVAYARGTILLSVTLSTSPGSAPLIYTGPVSVCGPRPGKSVRSFLISSMVLPGTTWLCECIIVSNTTVSPESTRSTGGCELSNQPHCVVSNVAGSSQSLPFMADAGPLACDNG